MAYDGQIIFAQGLKAGADLSAEANLHKFLKLTAAGTVGLCTAVTDIPVGVLYNRPKTGEAALVAAIGTVKIQGDADLSPGNLIGTSVDAQAAALVPGTDTTKYVVGQVLVDNTAAGGKITALINCASPHRAA